jgi:integrase
MLSLSAGIWFLPLDNPEGTTLNQQLTLPTTPAQRGRHHFGIRGRLFFGSRGWHYFGIRGRHPSESAAKIVPSLASKHVTPHSFRHAAAVHLVAAGVDITVIRSWLRHVSLDTPNHYAQTNLETKRKALERLDASSRASRPPRWRRDTSVLAWLDSL